MALETFKAQLKAKAKTLGVTNLSNKRIDAYAATLEKQNPNLTTDDDHAERIDAFLELIDIKEIAAMDDRNRSLAGKDGKGKGKDEPGKGKEGEETPTEPATGGDDVPAWAKTLIEQNKTLAQTVQQLQAKETRLTVEARLKETLKDIPHAFYKKWALPEKDEDFEAFVEEVKNEWTEFTKENPVTTTAAGSNQSTTTHRPARGAGATEKQATKEEVDSILGNIM